MTGNGCSGRYSTWRNFVTIFSLIQLKQRIFLRAVCQRWSLLIYDYSLLQHISLRKACCKDFQLSPLVTAAERLVSVDLHNSRFLWTARVFACRNKQVEAVGTDRNFCHRCSFIEDSCTSSGAQVLHLAGTRISNRCLPQIIGLKKLRCIAN